MIKKMQSKKGKVKIKEPELKIVGKNSKVQAEARCPHCGSKNVYGISRVVGYFSRIENWNKSKTAEFRDRQKGDYRV